MSGPANGSNGHEPAANGQGPAPANGQTPAAANGRPAGITAGGPGGPGARRRGPMGGGFGPGHGLSMPAEKARNFRGTFRRLLGELRPDRKWIVLVIAVSFFSTAGQIFGPKVLGNAINKLLDGLVGKQMAAQGVPVGLTHDQVVASLRAAHNPLADLVAGTNAAPGDAARRLWPGCCLYGHHRASRYVLLLFNSRLQILGMQVHPRGQLQRAADEVAGRRGGEDQALVSDLLSGRQNPGNGAGS